MHALALKKLPKINVYVDSPLSINATNIMRAHEECFNEDILEYMKKDEDPFGFNNLIYVNIIKFNYDYNEYIVYYDNFKLFSMEKMLDFASFFDKRLNKLCNN